MSTTLENCWGTDYWLRNCEGFRVRTEDGETGFVESVDLTPQGDVDGLVVRFGKEVTHPVRVPTRAVEALDPVDEMIILGPLTHRRPVCGLVVARALDSRRTPMPDQ